MEPWAPATAVKSAGKQETAACGAGVGFADVRIYKEENLQILAIFVMLSVVHFRQWWPGSRRELSLQSSQVKRHLPLAQAWTGLMPLPSWGVQTQRKPHKDGSSEGASSYTAIHRWETQGCPGLAR